MEGANHLLLAASDVDKYSRRQVSAPVTLCDCNRGTRSSLVTEAVMTAILGMELSTLTIAVAVAVIAVVSFVA